MSRDRLAALKGLLHEARVCLQFGNVDDALDYLHEAEGMLHPQNSKSIMPVIRGPQLRLAFGGR